MPTSAPVTRRDLLEAVIASGKVVSRIEIKEVTLGPKQSAPLHLHPCPVVGVVMAGAIAYQIEGETVRHLKVGDAFYEPSDVPVARFDNEGATPAKFAAFYLLGQDEHELIRIIST
jgi:quercetin dioxygenase-like cupin family protein